MRKRTSKVRIIAAGAVVAALGLAGSAFTAAGTVEASSASFGQETISAYNASDVHYNVGDGDAITSLDFTLDGAPATGGTVKIQLQTAGTWYNCTAPNGTIVDFNCVTTGETLTDATELSVVAAD